MAWVQQSVLIVYDAPVKSARDFSNSNILLTFQCFFEKMSTTATLPIYTGTLGSTTHTSRTYAECVELHKVAKVSTATIAVTVS